MKMRTTTLPQSCSSIEGNLSSFHMSHVIHSVIFEKKIIKLQHSPPPGLLIDCWELDEGWPGTRYTEPWRSQYNNGLIYRYIYIDM